MQGFNDTHRCEIKGNKIYCNECKQTVGKADYPGQLAEIVLQHNKEFFPDRYCKKDGCYIVRSPGRNKRFCIDHTDKPLYSDRTCKGAYL